MTTKQYTLSQIRDILDAELRGDPSTIVSGLADLTSAGENDLSFLSSKKYRTALAQTQASAVLVTEADVADCPGNALIVANPYYAYALLSRYFETRRVLPSGVHATAVVADSAEISASAAIGARCVIGENASIASGVELCAGVIIGDGVTIGKDSILHPNVVMYHDTHLGERVIVHANTTIGSDGFGFAPKELGWQKIHQLGRVIVGSDVEIGSNSSIDRGAIGDTLIADNVIIDNQVHIAHNCSVGEGTAIAGCAGIAGSTKIGKKCLLGGAVAVGGHLDIADGTMFNGATVVTKGNKTAGVFASAAPIQDVGAWRKNSARIRRLDDMYKRLAKLEKQLEENGQ